MGLRHPTREGEARKRLTHRRHCVCNLMHVYIGVYICAHTYKLHLYTFVFTCVYICVCRCTCVYICVYICSQSIHNVSQCPAVCCSVLQCAAVCPIHNARCIQGGEDPCDAFCGRSFFAKEPLIIAFFCGK